METLEAPQVVSSTLGAGSQVSSMASAIGEWMSLVVSEARNTSLDLTMTTPSRHNPESLCSEPSNKALVSLIVSHFVTISTQCLQRPSVTIRE